jgi:hypothetical protein
MTSRTLQTTVRRGRMLRVSTVAKNIAFIRDRHLYRGAA